MTILDRTLPELKLELEIAAYEAWSGRNMEGYEAMLPREKWADELDAEIEGREWNEKYPEHTKVRAIPLVERNAIGDFIEWLTETHSLPWGVEELMADYYHIDRERLSAEKDEMYKDLVKEA